MSSEGGREDNTNSSDADFRKRKSLREDKRRSYYRDSRSNFIQKCSKWSTSSKKPFLSGIIVLLPIIAILVFFHWIFGLIADLPFNNSLNFSNIYYLDKFIFLGVLIFGSIALAVGTGRFVQTRVGFKLERFIDQFFSIIPIIGSIYKFTKVTSETVLVSGSGELSKPVKIEFNGLRLTAFKTGNKTEDGREILFLPTSPNITTGFVLETPQEKILETNETSKEALTRTLSAGFGQDRIE